MSSIRANEFFSSDKIFLSIICGLADIHFIMQLRKTILHPTFKFKHKKGKKYLCNNNNNNNNNNPHSRHPHILATTKKKFIRFQSGKCLTQLRKHKNHVALENYFN